MFDNRRPMDPRYLMAPPPRTAYNPNGRNCIAQVGDYIVNRDGEIMIATTSNAGCATEFDKMVNEPCIRAKYIGNTDDCMECANQMRLATPAEIKRARAYVQQATLALDIMEVL